MRKMTTQQSEFEKLLSMVKEELEWTLDSLD